MNNYYLYLETIDIDGDICDRELIDTCSADSYQDCMKKSEWQGYDADYNEQYCIDEEDEDGFFDLGCYYPFGEAKLLEEIRKRPKYSRSVMINVRQALGLEPDDTSMDEEINDMDQIDVFSKWLQWEGIFGYTNRIKDAVDNIFYGK